MTLFVATKLILRLKETGSTLDFLLTASRNKQAAIRFFKKILGNEHVKTPRIISVDKNSAYPAVVDKLKKRKISSKRNSSKTIQIS